MPVVLDLCCGGGGAAEGYIRAGATVVGVDISDHASSYPGEFHQGDARDVMRWASLVQPDFIHASPPCQGYTTMSNRWRGTGSIADSRIPEIAVYRTALMAAGVPFVIENVTGARKAMFSPTVLTGEMFGLGVHRPRLFETSGWTLPPPQRPWPARVPIVGVYGQHDGRRLYTRKDGTVLRAARSSEEARSAMGILTSCLEDKEVSESIPPAYAEYVLTAFLASPTP